MRAARYDTKVGHFCVIAFGPDSTYLVGNSDWPGVCLTTAVPVHREVSGIAYPEFANCTAVQPYHTWM